MVDPNIKKKADDIRNKIYGREVRESLASGLEAMSSDVIENEGRQSVVEGRQDSVESQWREVSDEMTDKDVISAPEIISARDGEANLKARLDKEKNEVTAKLTQMVTFNVKNFGAVGDGTTDDTDAFLAMNKAIDEHDGNFKVLIPEGTFRFGRQTHQDGVYPYYKTVGSAIDIDGKSNFEIEFIGEIKINDRMRYGSFDKDTGDIYPKESGTSFTDVDYAAQVGNVVNIDNSDNFRIKNFNGDGNLQNAIIGGGWGDLGIQLAYSGLYIRDSKDFVVNKGTSKNFGLDGLYITGEELNSTINNFNSDMNGRQGFSITGCKGGLVVNNSIFQNTGKGKIGSAPQAGMDIEDNGGGNYGITFNDCTFRNNEGADVLTLGERTGDILFNNCDIYSLDDTTAIWSEANGVVFDKCKVGSRCARLSSDVKFIRTTFRRKENSKHSLTHRLIDGNVSGNSEFVSCSFYTERNGSDEFYIQSTGLIKDSKFIFKLKELDDGLRILLLEHVVLDNCEFIEINEGYPLKTSGNYAFMRIAGVTYKTKCYFQTTSIGVGSRHGSVNVVSGTNRVGFNYKETFNVVVDGMDSETSFETDDLPYGSYLLQITKRTGHGAYRKFGATLVINNTDSGVQGYHSGTVLNSNSVIPAEIDVKAETRGLKVVFNPKENAENLNGEEFLFTVISLEPFSAGL